VSRRYDAVVVGVGTMGSAALYHLARRGCRVLGIEQFDVAHEHGSMHGETRIIRLVYHEHAGYVPLARRAYELWYELDPTLVHTVGLLDVGTADSWLIAGGVQSCRDHQLAHELLDAGELRSRFPQHAAPPDHVGLLQPDGGYVEAERGVRAHVRAAVAAGAELRTGERVLGWASSGDVLEVRTDAASYIVDRLVLAPGAWAPMLLQLAGDLFVPTRQVIAWFATSGTSPEPVFIAEEDGDAIFYGITHAGRLKLGLMHHPGGTVDPDALDRDAREDELAALAEFAGRRLRGIGRLVEARVCLFTNTPDKHFVLDRHPEAENVVIVSACSGHGFKFAPAVGEIAADLVLEGETLHPIEFLRFGRLATV
jgi:sarcosine oxidase